MRYSTREAVLLEMRITQLLKEEEFVGHPLREALADLFDQYRDHLRQLERLTSISDGYQYVMRERNRSLVERYDKQVRHLRKIVQISDHYQQMLHDLNEAHKIAALHDPLTELPNRRMMVESLNNEVAAVERGREIFSIAILDIDHFKSINDNWGHEVGDAALVAITQEIRANLRAYDICARWGGEEFLILLPETFAATAMEVAERLRARVDQLQLTPANTAHCVTVSIGVAQHQRGATYSQTLKRADDALYEAKSVGRNHVVLAK